MPQSIYAEPYIAVSRGCAWRIVNRGLSVFKEATLTACPAPGALTLDQCGPPLSLPVLGQ